MTLVAETPPWKETRVAKQGWREHRGGWKNKSDNKEDNLRMKIGQQYDVHPTVEKENLSPITSQSDLQY